MMATSQKQCCYNDRYVPIDIHAFSPLIGSSLIGYCGQNWPKLWQGASRSGVFAHPLKTLAINKAKNHLFVMQLLLSVIR